MEKVRRTRERRGGRAVDRGVRDGPEGQSVQDLESDVVGQLLSAAGAGGGDTEAARRGVRDARGAHRGRPGRADGGGRAVGAEGGADVPSGFLRLSAGTVGAGRGGRVPAAVLEQRLGDRSGHPEVLRQRAVGPGRQGGGGQHRPAVGVAVCEAVAARAGAAARRHAASSGTAEPRKGRRSRRCWRICSCTTRSTRGWPGSSRRSSSNATSTTRSCTASASARPARCWPRSRTGWSRSGCGCIRTRPGSCTARTGGGAARTSTRRSRSWGTRSGRGRRGAGTAACSPAFLPAISKDALKKISGEVRSWRLHRRTGHTFADLARWINPIVRAGCKYYGGFYRSALYPLLARINAYLVRWIRKKYKRLRAFKKAHARAGAGSPPVPAPLRALEMGPRVSGDQDDKSPVTGDCHAGICGSPGVRSLRATRPPRSGPNAQPGIML